MSAAIGEIVCSGCQARHEVEIDRKAKRITDRGFSATAAAGWEHSGKGWRCGRCCGGEWLYTTWEGHRYPGQPSHFTHHVRVRVRRDTGEIQAEYFEDHPKSAHPGGPAWHRIPDNEAAVRFYDQAVNGKPPVPVPLEKEFAAAALRVRQAATQEPGAWRSDRCGYQRTLFWKVESDHEFMKVEHEHLSPTSSDIDLYASGVPSGMVIVREGVRKWNPDEKKKGVWAAKLEPVTER